MTRECNSFHHKLYQVVKSCPWLNLFFSLVPLFFTYFVPYGFLHELNMSSERRQQNVFDWFSVMKGIKKRSLPSISVTQLSDRNGHSSCHQLSWVQLDWLERVIEGPVFYSEYEAFYICASRVRMERDKFFEVWSVEQDCPFCLSKDECQSNMANNNWTLFRKKSVDKWNEFVWTTRSGQNAFPSFQQWNSRSISNAYKRPMFVPGIWWGKGFTDIGDDGYTCTVVPEIFDVINYAWWKYLLVQLYQSIIHWTMFIWCIWFPNESSFTFCSNSVTMSFTTILQPLSLFCNYGPFPPIEIVDVHCGKYES